MTYSLILDNREHKLVNYFKDVDNVKIEQLDLGDIVFKIEDEVSIIIERKSVKDLFSSIKDGRFREQKKRLLANYNSEKIMYLIEGAIPNYNTNTYYGSLINSLIRDNLKIFQTKNIEETIKFIEIIKKRHDDKVDYLFKPETHPVKQVGGTGYLETIKLKKKDNMTPENFQLIVLAQIPGMSLSKAAALIEKYGNIANIIELLKINDSDELKDIKVNNRRLGEKVSLNIKKYLDIN